MSLHYPLSVFRLCGRSFGHTRIRILQQFDMDGGYLLALFVTLEQECAIRNMFREKEWIFVKAELKSEQLKDIDLQTDILEDVGDDCTPSTEYPRNQNEVIGPNNDCHSTEETDSYKPEPDVTVLKNATSWVPVNTISSYSIDIKIEQDNHDSHIHNQSVRTNQKVQSLISRGKLLSLSNKDRESSVSDRINSNKSCLNISKRYICKKRPIYCVDCKITFTSQARYDKHKQRNAGKCVFACEFCDKVFLYRKSRYDLHVRSAHSKERPFTCDVCGRGYVTSDKLKIHKRQHTGEKPCVCEECGKSFYSRGELSVHRDYHHTPRTNDVQCDICNMTFCSKKYLLYHKNVTHSSVRDFHCTMCSNSFKSNSSLKRHVKVIHSESKKFECKTCNKMFKTTSSLKKHMVRHSGERTHFCTECNKGFYEKFKLLQHYRTHSGEKPYQCDQCDYRCALAGNLTKHKKTHYKQLTQAVQ